MISRSIALGIVFAAGLAACGGDDKGSSTSSSGGSSSGSTSSSSSSGSSGATDTDAGGTAPQAAGPKITEVMKMMGSLHVMWDLPKATCDNVLLERKDGTAEFKVVYTLPGAADNKHDASATGDMTYTYRARCKVGAEYTEYSNEMGGNPTK